MKMFMRGMTLVSLPVTAMMPTVPCAAPPPVPLRV